jgi:hypothetical protein
VCVKIENNELIFRLIDFERIWLNSRKKSRQFDTYIEIVQELRLKIAERMSIAIRASGKGANTSGLFRINSILNESFATTNAIRFLQFTNDAYFLVDDGVDDEEVDDVVMYPMAVFWSLLREGCFDNMHKLRFLTFDNISDSSLELPIIRRGVGGIALNITRCKNLVDIRIDPGNTCITSFYCDECPLLTNVAFLSNARNVNEVVLMYNERLADCSNITRQTFPNLHEVVIIHNPSLTHLPSVHALHDVPLIKMYENATPLMFVRE